MGNKQSTVPENKQPEKTHEELMKERWLKLAQTPQISQEAQQQQNTPIENISTKNSDNSQNISKEVYIQEKQETLVGPKPKVKPEPVIHTLEEPQQTSISVSELKKEVPPEPQVKKPIDKEHSTIEKIFRISLSPNDKFTYLETYHGQLLSESKEEAFRINDLDSIIMSIINHPNRKAEIINYMLETYHRAIEVIERRFKHDLEDKYQSVRREIASYLALIIYNPENFELTINRNEIVTHLIKYFNDTDDEELGFLFSDIISSTSDDFSFLEVVLSLIFNIIHLDNMNSKNTLLNYERMRRNLQILLKMFVDNKIAREAYVVSSNFLPKNIQGKQFQTVTYLGAYHNIISFEQDLNALKNTLGSLNQVRSLLTAGRIG